MKQMNGNTGLYYGSPATDAGCDYLVIGPNNNVVGIDAGSPEEALEKRLSYVGNVTTRGDLIGELYTLVGTSPVNGRSTVTHLRFTVEPPQPLPARIVVQAAE